MHHTLSAGHFGIGLEESEVRRLQDILRRRHSVHLPIEDVWQRAIELIEFGLVMLDSLPAPEALLAG